MIKSILSSIEIKFLVQATEDEEKIINKISKKLQIPFEKFEKTTLEGHFGNPIKFFRIHISGKNADYIANEIMNLLKNEWKRKLKLEIINHIDEHGSLFIRIDKQSFFSDKLTQSSIDAVRVKIKPKFREPLPKMIIMYKSLIKS